MKDYDYAHFEKILGEKNLKAIDVSKATGIATSTLSDWKAGRSTPKNDKLTAIADFLEVPMHQLRTGEKNMRVKISGPNGSDIRKLYSVFDEVVDYVSSMNDETYVFNELFKMLDNEDKHKLMNVIGAMFPEEMEKAEYIMSRNILDLSEETSAIDKLSKRRRKN